MAIPVPSPLVVGNVVKGVVRGVAFGQEVINTFYWACRVAPVPGVTAPKTADLLDKLKTVFRAGPIVQLTSDYVVLEYWMYNMDGVMQSGVPPNIIYAQQLIDGSILIGDDNDDRGTVETPAAPLLDAMSVRCIPVTINKFTRRTVRFSPIPASGLDPDNPEWTDAMIALWAGATLPSFWILSDAAWTVEFYPINFSTATAATLGNPAPGRNFATAYSRITEVQPRKLVRSQVSRKPSNYGY